MSWFGMVQGAEVKARETAKLLLVNLDQRFPPLQIMQVIDFANPGHAVSHTLLLRKCIGCNQWLTQHDCLVTSFVPAGFCNVGDRVLEDHGR